MLIGLNLLPQPAQALNWNFSYTAGNLGGEGVAGTVNAVLTTDGTDYNTTTIYTISGISGTANGYSITGLWTTSLPDSPFSADNQFGWNGTTGIRLSINGIAFYNSALQVNNIFGTTPPSNFFNTTSGGSSSEVGVSASSLTAVPWETDALPMIGSTVLIGLGFWAKGKFAKPLQK